MPDGLFLVLVVTVWVSIGLLAVLASLTRHGRRSRYWYAIGVVLGPLMLPIALELGRTRGRLVDRTVPGPGSPAPPHGAAGGGTSTVLVAVDGSPESHRAAEEAASFLDPAASRVVLVTVLDPDDTGTARQAEAEATLVRASACFVGFADAVREIDSGDPSAVLLDCVVGHDVDLVVLGRRGEGLSHRLLGSVADRLVRRARVPVLLGTPAPVPAGGRQARRSREAGAGSARARTSTPVRTSRA